MGRSRYVPLALMTAAVFSLTACDRSPASDPDYVAVDGAELLSACLVEPETEVSGTVGILGGVVSGGGVTLTLPAGAVLSPTQFDIRIPESPYAEAEIRANDQDHFRFLLPVVISISYARCGTPSGNLTAWHIDPDSRLFLENMGGVNDVLNRRITFSTMHLSGYAIAN